MSKGINKVIIVGNLGNDPEVKSLPNGDAVTNISVATSESWKDKSTGQQQERTEWHRIVFFKRLAEIAGQYLSKGSKVYIEGSLRTRKWQDQSGNDRYSTEIIASQMQMLDSRSDDAPQQSAQQPAPQQGTGVNPQQHMPSTSAAPQQPVPYQQNYVQAPQQQQDNFDDDSIPF